MNLYKKFGISKKKAKPGDLISALNERKAKGGAAGLFKKNHKSHMCKSCEKSCSSMSHHKMHKNISGAIHANSRHSHLEKKHEKHEKKHEKHYKKHKKNDGDSDSKFDREASKEEKLKTKKKNWIAGAIKKPGALHRELGVKEGHKIPAGRLRAAAKKGGKIGKRARLAETLKGLHHKKHKKGYTGFDVSNGSSQYGRNIGALNNFGRSSMGNNGPIGGNANSTVPMAKRKAKKHKTHKKVGPQEAVASGPMVGSVGGYKKKGKKA